MTERLFTTQTGERIWLTRKQVETCAMLTTTRKGGFASLSGYRAKTGYTSISKTPLMKLIFTSRFSVENMYKKEIASLNELSFSDLNIPESAENLEGQNLIDFPYIASLTEDERKELFESCVQKMIDTKEDSLSRENQLNTALKEGIALNKVQICKGVFIPVVNEKTEEGNLVPVLKEGHKQGKDSINMGRLDVKKSYHCPECKNEVGYDLVCECGWTGERKLTKRRKNAKVPMDNLILKALKKHCIGYKSLSLTSDNYETLKIDGEEFKPSDISININVEDLETILEVEEIDNYDGCYKEYLEELEEELETVAVA